MDYEAFMKIIRGRRSIRFYRPDPVDDETISQIIEAGKWAPSGNNTQPFEIVLVNDKNLVEQIDMAAAYFVNITYNKILKRPFGEEIVQTQTGRNTTKGYEASVKFFQLNKDLTMTVAYTNLNIDNPLLYEYKPEDNLNLQLEYVSPFGFHINSIFFYEGKSYAWYLDAENELITHRIKGSYDLDLSIGYRLNFLGLGYEFHLAGYNILDNSEYDYYYLKKRYLQASFAIKY